MRGLEVMRERLGVEPRIHCNHGQNAENLYWGAHRYRALPVSHLMRWIGRQRKEPAYQGERRGSPYFWGDICRERIPYVRRFAFRQLDISALPVTGPYSLPSTPFVKYWFDTSDAPDVLNFNELVTRRAVDELCSAGGYCILSTHLGKGFVRGGRVDSQVEDTLRYMATLRGWYPPASELLDHLLDGRVATSPTLGRQLQLEALHVVDRMSSRRNRLVK